MYFTLPIRLSYSGSWAFDALTEPFRSFRKINLQPSTLNTPHTIALWGGVSSHFNRSGCVMLLTQDSSQLVLLDYQPKLLSGIAEVSGIVKNATILATLAKKMHLPVFATEHVPDKLGAFDAALSGFCKAKLRTTHFSACADGLLDLLSPKQVAGNARSLPKHLQKTQPQNERLSVVVAGVEAHVSVLQTALDLLDHDFDVWVVTDACASRSERNRDAAFDRLAGNGAELVSTEMVVFEWLESSESEFFKFSLDLIK